MMEKIEKELECAICGGIMVDPRTLACQHCFCLRCLHRMTRGAASFEIKCPLGCEERTVGEDGVNALPRIHVVRNLCNMIRMQRFRAEENVCDWCEQEDNSPIGTPHTATGTGGSPLLGRGTVGTRKKKMRLVCCSRCCSYICEGCATDPSSDHAMLCSPPTAIAEARPLRYPHLFTQPEAIAVLLAHLRHQRPGLEVVSCAAEAQLQRAFSSEVTIRGTQHGESQSIRVSVLALADSLIRGESGGDEFEHGYLPSSTELVALYEVRELSHSVYSGIRALLCLLDSTKKCVGISATAYELASCFHLAKCVAHCIEVERSVIRPLCREVSVLASLTGYAVIGRVQAKIVGAEQSMTGRMQLHQIAWTQGMAVKAQDCATSTADQLREISILAEEKYADYVKAIAVRLAKGVAPPEPNRRGLLDLPNVHAEALRGVLQIMEAVNAVRRIQTRLLEWITDLEPSLSNAIQRVYDESRAIAVWSDALFESLGQLQSLAVVWTGEPTSLAGATACGLDHCIAAWLSTACDDDAARRKTAALDTVNSMADSLVPQIQNIRLQHVVLLQQSPHHVQGHQLLQDQLKPLLLQAGELFQKEHRLLLRQRLYVSEEALQALVDAAVASIGACKAFDEFCASLKRHRAGSSTPTSPTTPAGASATAAVPDADEAASTSSGPLRASSRRQRRLVIGDLRTRLASDLRFHGSAPDGVRRLFLDITESPPPFSLRRARRFDAARRRILRATHQDALGSDSDEERGGTGAARGAGHGGAEEDSRRDSGGEGLEEAKGEEEETASEEEGEEEDDEEPAESLLRSGGRPVECTAENGTSVAVSMGDPSMIAEVQMGSMASSVRDKLKAASQRLFKSHSVGLIDPKLHPSRRPPAAVLVPSFLGTYKVNGQPDRVYEFRVCGATLKLLSCELPALKGIRAVLHRSHDVLRSPTAFFVANGIALALLVAVDVGFRISHLVGGLRGKRWILPLPSPVFLLKHLKM